MPSPTAFVKRHSQREIASTDIAVEQPPDIELPVDAPLQRKPDTIKPIDAKLLASLSPDYVDELAFMAEPVTIVIHPPSEPNGSPVTDMIAVEGKRAEILLNGRWVEWGYLPKGQEITVKRMTVEVLARAKREAVTTSIQWLDREPQNRVHRFLSVRDPFSVLHDRNPKGGEWVTRILAGRA